MAFGGFSAHTRMALDAVEAARRDLEQAADKAAALRRLREAEAWLARQEEEDRRCWEERD